MQAKATTTTTTTTATTARPYDWRRLLSITLRHFLAGLCSLVLTVYLFKLRPASSSSSSSPLWDADRWAAAAQPDDDGDDDGDDDDLILEHQDL